MFEQTFVEGRVKTSRGWPVFASLFFQVTAVCSAILIPLLNPDLLPRAMVNGVFLAPAMQPPPPPPPPGARTAQKVARAVNRIWDGAHLLMPRAIPQKVANLEEAASEMGVPGGVENGVPGGIPNPVLRNLGQQWLGAPPPPPPPAVKPSDVVKPQVQRVAVGGKVQDALLVRKVIPRYPELALRARVEGKVTFSALIGANGMIQGLQLVSGHPLLVGAATDAVRQWLYRPTLLNGEPVEVATTIEVTFTLNR
jgi:protein TonB